jgi:hypothetical protein
MLNDDFLFEAWNVDPKYSLEHKEEYFDLQKFEKFEDPRSPISIISSKKSNSKKN